TAFANEPAQRFLRARHADVLAEQAMAELLEQAVQGDAGERELQLFGPPKEMLHIRAVPLRDGAGVVGAVAFVRDVSEARRTDSVRRDFVANVSHELKTPIGALALLAETMAVGNDTAVMQQLAERVLREADRLGRIVDDLLDLSLIEAQEAPSRQPVPAEHLISEAVERVRAAAEANGAPLVVAEPAADLVLVCDHRQVVSAITNLLDNAVKYSEGDQPVEVSAIAERGRLVISVRDRGVGIPARDLERIFERFYRVDRARSRATGGTGLGLAIVRHVAHAHGGDVEVQSIEGEGSTFRLRLPLSEATGQVIGMHSRTERSSGDDAEPMKGVS
ncbi:MAG: ATP-binding protein, partial [Acidimicrobiia bacterium]